MDGEIAAHSNERICALPKKRLSDEKEIKTSSSSLYFEETDETLTTVTNNNSNNNNNSDSKYHHDIITANESKGVNALKTVMYLTLVFSAMAVVLATVWFVQDEHQQTLELEVEAMADRAISDVQTYLDGISTQLFDLGMSFSSEYQSSQVSSPPWVNLTLPHFDQRIKNQPESELVFYTPIIPVDYRNAWRNYSIQNQNWIDEALFERGWDALTTDIRQEIYAYPNREIATTAKTIITSAENIVQHETLTPIWQISPVPRNRSIINLDAMTVPALESLRHAPSPNGIIKARMSPTLEAKFFLDFVETKTDPMAPRSFLSMPVYQTFDRTSNTKPFGYVFALVSWYQAIEQAFQKSHFDISVIIQEGCGNRQIFTFLVELDGTVQYRAPSDDPLPVYHPSLKKDFDLLFDDGCNYQLTVHPLEGAESELTRGFPILGFVITSIVLLVLVVVFFQYTRLVRDRQRKLLATAIRSNAVVSSLFPEAFQNRLMDEVEEQQTQTRRFKKRSNSAKFNKLQDFIDGEQKKSAAVNKSRPIADFFPETTIMFADIVGFTAWSSMREPTQVFFLLESIYHAFDEIARQRQVFKVETIGDCYVAVVGLPEPCDEHALVMARFAHDCRLKINEIVKQLEVTLGPDTADLTMRIGLHSGPVTAGVLRGDKARFQLFGDTMNTASRIETTGKQNRIHVSETTAEYLINAGKENWLTLRDEKVAAKGKGELTTYWLRVTRNRKKRRNTLASQTSRSSASDESVISDLQFSKSENGTGLSEKEMRLVNWITNQLISLLEMIEYKRTAVFLLNSRNNAHSRKRGGLSALATVFKENVVVKDRKYHMKTYPQCFVCREAVDFLVQSGNASNREEAVSIGRALQSMNLFEHVTRDHHFNDDYLFFRFKEDGGKGSITLTIEETTGKAVEVGVGGLITSGGSVDVGGKVAHSSPESPVALKELEQESLRNMYTKRPLDEVSDIIDFPAFDSGLGDFLSMRRHGSDVTLDESVQSELRDYIASIAAMYTNNLFHNFEHASHVTMSVVKLLSGIAAPGVESDVYDNAIKVHGFTYGIASDPLTHFTLALSALIHDVDHPGVPNVQLMKENTQMSTRYKMKSIAEQNSFDKSWQLLMEERYLNLRRAVYQTKSEYKRFRQLLINAVLATDIMDNEIGKKRKERWDKAFNQKLEEDPSILMNRKATVVIEHIIQASDVAHTMQHWHVYRKWNGRLFEEMYKAFRDKRAVSNPADTWYQGEIDFFDSYIIPLAKKLKDCGVFGVSIEECLNYAQQNRQELALTGKKVVGNMMKAMRLDNGPLRGVSRFSNSDSMMSFGVMSPPRGRSPVGGSASRDASLDSSRATSLSPPPPRSAYIRGLSFKQMSNLSPLQASHKGDFSKSLNRSTHSRSERKAILRQSESFSIRLNDNGDAQSHNSALTADSLLGQDDVSIDSKLELPIEMNVLIIDDDKLNRKLFIRAVMSIAPKWTVSEVESAEEALKLIGETVDGFDVIFMDQYAGSEVGNLLGTDAVEMLRNEGVNSLICGMSEGDSEFLFDDAGGDSNANNLLPFQPSALLREVNRIMLHSGDLFNW